jgi:hypothetical protein
MTPVIRAALYREKARGLYEAAASARNEELREQFETLAPQYEILAESIESTRDLRPA